MKLTTESIRWLHLELSSKCNAWCPGCKRNKQGHGLADHLIEQDLDLEILNKVLLNLPNLETVQFCGNLGDPIIASNILEAIDLCTGKKIQIHTNGSLRNVSWWTNFGQKLKNQNHDVWFGIDGLEGVHEIYRQGTSFSKIIENVQAFISAGGNAIWQFIPYEHNEHQIYECLKLSKKLKFKSFKLAKLHRTMYKAYHYKTGEPFDLAPPKTINNIIRFAKSYHSVKVENCMHISYPSIYLNANGKLSVCCYHHSNQFDSLNDLLYNVQNLNNNICLKNCGS
jgi:MoaA/NifB/PqqE/SkfB family radical SAM enzyme